MFKLPAEAVTIQSWHLQDEEPAFAGVGIATREASVRWMEFGGRCETLEVRSGSSFAEVLAAFVVDTRSWWSRLKAVRRA